MFLCRHSAVLESIYSPIILGLGVIGTFSMCMVIFHAVVVSSFYYLSYCYWQSIFFSNATLSSFRLKVDVTGI